MTSTKLFVDTNIFVALRDETDSTYKKAQALLRKISKERYILYTSSDVIGETLTVISKKLGKGSARKFLEYIDSGLVNEIFIDEQLHQRARELFAQTPQKNISFIDCSSVIAMKSQKIDTIFSFDQDFKKLGLSLFS
jgi:predicted nucleic acid-binding protein